MADVSIVSCKSYDRQECDRAMEEVLESVGGINWVQPGMCIAIKANLVGAYEPEKAATTHPSLLASLTRLLKARGARVIIGDSPGGLYNEAFLNRVYKTAGLQEAVEAGAELNHDFSQKNAQYPDGKIAKSFAYTAWLDQADEIISFCKLKSHGMMALSAATKNQFGVVPGTAKPEYHFRYPEPLDFAGMILDLNGYFKPRLFLVDGVVAMEGNGPTAGVPRPVGVLIGGADCHKVDMVCAKLIGLEPMTVPTLRAAANYGYVSETGEEIEISGDPDRFRVENFERILQPKSMQFRNVLPGKAGVLFGNLARACLRPRPKLKAKECIGCGLCGKICPAKAIRIEKKKAVIDKSVCIRCFCCQEFCPKGAMKVHRTLIARILNP
ncbi:MAG: DUF362 domain-containing protein [Oscillospiraceae bacterium]|nr:DUF362 domain-containing protein [Oscillospiraceae bacterium]